MALNLKYSASLKNLQMDGLTTRLGASALIDIMGGPQPANPDTTIVLTTLNGTIVAGATTVVVTSATGLPGAGNYTLWIDSEQMTVTAGQGTTSLTVTRGVNGTTAAGHTTGTNVTNTPILATLTCNATFAPASSGGVITLNAITSGTGSTFAGPGSTAAWFRLKTSGATPHIDGTVGTAGCDLNLNNTSIATGQSVAISSFVVTNGN